MSKESAKLDFNTDLIGNIFEETDDSEGMDEVVNTSVDTMMSQLISEFKMELVEAPSRNVIDDDDKTANVNTHLSTLSLGSSNGATGGAAGGPGAGRNVNGPLDDKTLEARLKKLQQ